MITRLHIVFRTRPHSQDALAHSVRLWLDTLEYYGYVIRSGSDIMRSLDGSGVSLEAHFTGRDAFASAWADARCEDEREFIAEDSIGEPVVHQRRRYPLVPSCRCPWRDKVALDLWCTPWSGCPPLLCSKGGVLPYYKLPLRRETLARLDEWNTKVRHLGELTLTGEMEQHPIGREAARRLADPRGWVARESRAVSRMVAKDTGREVRTFLPPIGVMRL